jgi:hypothetical protein
MIEDLVKAIKNRQAILFAGAGISMSVGLPSWRTLIEQMGQELGFDAEIFANPDTSYFTLAEYYRLQQGSIGPLRSWMDRNWAIPEEKLKQSQVHELIVALDFPIIYTTNFDRNLETSFHLRGKKFVKVTNAKDVARVQDGVTQIVKFHGDFDDDQTLVLAESDYFERLAFDSPLDVKFQADALGKTILFAGYSLSDLNIRLILYRLWRRWRQSGYEKDRPRSYVFMMRPNPIEEAVLAQWGITAVNEDTDDPESALEVFLAKLKERVDAD